MSLSDPTPRRFSSLEIPPDSKGKDEPAEMLEDFKDNIEKYLAELEAFYNTSTVFPSPGNPVDNHEQGDWRSDTPKVLGWEEADIRIDEEQGGVYILNSSLFIGDRHDEEAAIPVIPPSLLGCQALVLYGNGQAQLPRFREGDVFCVRADQIHMPKHVHGRLHLPAVQEAMFPDHETGNVEAFNAWEIMLPALREGNIVAGKTQNIELPQLISGNVSAPQARRICLPELQKGQIHIPAGGLEELNVSHLMQVGGENIRDLSVPQNALWHIFQRYNDDGLYVMQIEELTIPKQFQPSVEHYQERGWLKVNRVIYTTVR